MEITATKEEALYVACGLYRAAYDKLVITTLATKDNPDSPQSRKLISEALSYLREKKTELRKALDDSERQDA